MTIGRRAETLAATLRPRLRPVVTWACGGAAALFVANIWSGWAMLVVVPVIALRWLWLAIDGAGAGWRMRAAGIPALLLPAMPLVVLPFAGFLFDHALYWSQVAPSWWRLRSDRTGFDAARSGGATPPGVLRVERRGRRIAFVTTRGMPGEYRAGIVHDPTERMAAARGWGGGPVAADVRHLFNGDTIWCQRLDSRWFHCQFG